MTRMFDIATNFQHLINEYSSDVKQKQVYLYII